MDTIVDVLLLFKLGAPPRGRSALQPCVQRLLLFPDLRLLKHVVREELQGIRTDDATAGIAHRIKDLRVIEAELEKERAQCFSPEPQDADGGRVTAKPDQKRMICLLLQRRKRTLIALQSAHAPLPSLARPGLS